jgi:hypothetical protein
MSCGGSRHADFEKMHSAFLAHTIAKILGKLAHFIIEGLAVKLERFKVAHHQISRQIIRMNKRLEKEFGEQVAEKRGWHWAMTSFTLQAIGETESL